MNLALSRIVKGYICDKYEVELMQDEEGRYFVRYALPALEEEHFSEFITDYGTASYMFDLKIQELEGN